MKFSSAYGWLLLTTLALVHPVAAQLLGQPHDTAIEIEFDSVHAAHGPAVITIESSEGSDDFTLLEAPSNLTRHGDSTRSANPRQREIVHRFVELFCKLDRDRNGKLSRSEATHRLVPVFSRLDVQFDGALDIDEWTSGMVRLVSRRGYTLPLAEARTMTNTSALKTPR